MDVVLVAVKKSLINDYTTVLEEAGLAPAVVDVDAFASAMSLRRTTIYRNTGTLR